jgi:hypothetical protein
VGEGLARLLNNTVGMTQCTTPDFHNFLKNKIFMEHPSFPEMLKDWSVVKKGSDK